MHKLLLLYDITEKDLARDFQDLFRELSLEVNMIATAPNLGLTLEAKERHYFDQAEGAVFLITPGSKRHGIDNPSASVADEMGHAKRRFGKEPERIIYLVDKACSIQAVDQRAYVAFDRGDIRSIVDAITQVIRNLKTAGLVGQREIPPRETPSVDIKAVTSSTPSHLRQVCLDLADKPSGAMLLTDLYSHLTDVRALSQTDANFAVGDLQTNGLATYVTPGHFIQLTALGWNLVRHVRGEPRFLLDLSDVFSQFASDK